jgi:hypothetical protein
MVLSGRRAPLQCPHRLEVHPRTHGAPDPCSTRRTQVSLCNTEESWWA